MTLPEAALHLPHPFVTCSIPRSSARLGPVLGVYTSIRAHRLKKKKKKTGISVDVGEAQEPAVAYVEVLEEKPPPGGSDRDE